MIFVDLDSELAIEDGISFNRERTRGRIEVLGLSAESTDQVMVKAIILGILTEVFSEHLIKAVDLQNYPGERR